MSELALGMIETKGLVGAIEAADAMTKTSDVKVLGYEITGGALVIIKIEGEVAAVRTAIEAGARRAELVGRLISSHIIPRPHNETDLIIYSDNVIHTEKTEKGDKEEKKTKGKKK